MTTAEPIASDHAAELRRVRLGHGLKAVYGLGTLVDGFTQAALVNFLFFYLTAVCGLPNTLAGVSTFVALVVDAVADPLVGSLSDNSTSRWGRRHPFMFAGVLPVAVGLGMLFSVPSGLSVWALFAYVTVFSIVVRGGHSVFNLPYVALGAELSDDYAERTKIVSSRFLFGAIAAIACLELGQQVFLKGSAGLLNRAGYAPFGWTCGALALAGGLACAIGTFGQRARLHQVAAAKGTALVRLIRDMIEIFKNPSFVVLFVCMLAVFVGYGAATSLAIHANTFFWRLPNQVTFYVLVAVQLGILVGIALSVILADRTEKRTVVRVGLIVALTSFISLPWLQIWGLLPPPGPVLYAIIVGNAFLVVGVISGGVAIAFQSALADAADEHEYMFGTRREGLYYAGLNFAVKCAGGLGGLVGGVGLDLIHFPTGLVGHGGLGVHIPADTIRNLGLLQGMSAAVMYALATVVFFFYRLTRAKHAVILEELRERRRGAEPV